LSETEDVEFLEEKGDPTVDPELLELYVELEITGVTPEEFADAFGN